MSTDFRAIKTRIKQFVPLALLEFYRRARNGFVVPCFPLREPFDLFPGIEGHEISLPTGMLERGWMVGRAAAARVVHHGGEVSTTFPSVTASKRTFGAPRRAEGP